MEMRPLVKYVHGFPQHLGESGSHLLITSHKACTIPGNAPDLCLTAISSAPSIPATPAARSSSGTPSLPASGPLHTLPLLSWGALPPALPKICFLMPSILFSGVTHPSAPAHHVPTSDTELSPFEISLLMLYPSIVIFARRNGNRMKEEKPVYLFAVGFLL